MPGGDGTGPMGLGPMTGRVAGFCAGYPVPGFMNPIGGRLGLGLGWGRGFWGRWMYPYYGYGLPYSPWYGAYGYRPYGAYGIPYWGYGMPYGY